MAVIRILHTNDLHGKLTSDRVPFLQDSRHGCDLYFDSGDCVKSGNLSIPAAAESVWPLLCELDCTASVPGNRESHPLMVGWQAKVSGAQHPLVCANMFHKNGERVLPASICVHANGLKIGIVGAMVPMVTEKMASRHVSQIVWKDAIQSAVSEADQLQSEVDMLIALTHIGYRQDIELAMTNRFDLILGGHSHTVLEKPERHGRAWIAQGGSHARYAGVYEWEGVEVSGGLIRWEVDA